MTLPSPPEHNTGLHRETGHEAPALVGMTEAEIRTPALVIDLDMFERNLIRMRQLCADMGVALRAHGKMHKSADIALRQIEVGGATGICCQKVSEAETFARAGIRDILITNQVRDPVMIGRLARLARGARIGVCIDDADNIPDLSAAAHREGSEVRVLVEIDCGAGRCGVPPGPPAVALAKALATAPGLIFAGIQAYHGPAQHVRDFSARKALVYTAIQHAGHTRAAIEAAGIPCPTVTGAGTGSFMIEGRSGTYTELQCGSYAFMDAAYGRVRDTDGAPPADTGAVSGFGNALFVLTSVMSTAVPGQAVCDAGLKAHSVDSGLPLVFGRTDVEYSACSDEHGVLRDPENRLHINERLKLVPGHCDPTCNLHDWYVGLRGGRVECLWPVSARGKLW